MKYKMEITIISNMYCFYYCVIIVIFIAQVFSTIKCSIEIFAYFYEYLISANIHFGYTGIEKV